MLDLSEDEEASRELRVHKAALDLEFFAVEYFPHYCEHPFNEFHYEDFDSLVFGERGARRVRGAPRGYAKSTLKALIKPIHDVCYGLENFILIVSNTESQAVQKLRDIRSEFLGNDRLLHDFRVSFPTKKMAETVLEVSNGSNLARLEAFGYGTEMRGIRFGSFRPTKIICDDVEHSEEVFNEAIRKKYFDKYAEVISKVGNEKTNIEFIGTVLHRESLLQNILKNPMYDSKLYKAVKNWSEREDLWQQWREIITDLENDNRIKDSDAFYKANEVEMMRGVKVLWPEKEPYLALMKEMIETGTRAFMKEKQNEPLGAEDKVFSLFHWYREAEKDGQKGFIIEKSNVFIPVSRLRPYGVIDPATGQSKAKKGKLGDFSCILTGYSDDKGRIFVHNDWTRRAAPTQQIEQLIELHLMFEYEKFGVETNLYRNLLLPNIIRAREEIEKKLGRKIRLPLYDIEQVENKEKRIFSMEPKVTNGWVLLNRNLSQEFKNQLEDFPHGDHDDCPDALEMLWGIVNGRYRMSPVGIDPTMGR